MGRIGAYPLMCSGRANNASFEVLHAWYEGNIYVRLYWYHEYAWYVLIQRMLIGSLSEPA